MVATSVVIVTGIVVLALVAIAVTILVLKKKKKENLTKPKPKKQCTGEKYWDANRKSGDGTQGKCMRNAFCTENDGDIKKNDDGTYSCIAKGDAKARGDPAGKGRIQLLYSGKKECVKKSEKERQPNKYWWDNNKGACTSAQCDGEVVDGECVTGKKKFVKEVKEAREQRGVKKAEDFAKYWIENCPVQFPGTRYHKMKKECVAVDGPNAAPQNNSATNAGPVCTGNFTPDGDKCVCKVQEAKPETCECYPGFTINHDKTKCM